MLNWTVDSIQYGPIKRLQKRKHDVFKDYKSQYSRRTRSSTQFQRFKCCSILSIYRPPFAGYVSKSCPISARSSPDSSTSTACKFSNVRFTFLWSAPGSTTTMKKKRNGAREWVVYSRRSRKWDDVVAKSTNPSNAQLRKRDAFTTRYDRQRFNYPEVITDVLRDSWVSQLE